MVAVLKPPEAGEELPDGLDLAVAAQPLNKQLPLLLVQQMLVPLSSFRKVLGTLNLPASDRVELLGEDAVLGGGGADQVGVAQVDDVLGPFLLDLDLDVLVELREVVDQVLLRGGDW